MMTADKKNRGQGTLTGRQQHSNALYVEKVILKELSPVPAPRTYHASCLHSKYMVTIGGETTSD